MLKPPAMPPAGVQAIMHDSLLVALVESRPYSAEALHELAQPLLREHGGDTHVTERLLQTRANEVRPVLCHSPNGLPSAFGALPTEPRQAYMLVLRVYPRNIQYAFVRLL